MYRCATVSVSVTVILALVLLIVLSPEAEAVTIATQPLAILRVSVFSARESSAVKISEISEYFSTKFS